MPRLFSATYRSFAERAALQVGRPAAYWLYATEEVGLVVSQGTQDWSLEGNSDRGNKVIGMAAFCRHYPRPGPGL